MQLEEPRLEQQKGELVVTVAAGKRRVSCNFFWGTGSEVIILSPSQLVDLENMILKLLSEAKGSLLDDQDLVDTLQVSTCVAVVLDRCTVYTARCRPQNPRRKR